jgi:putative membrane protein
MDADWYLWLKAGHIISFTAWMAGLFYLPRLFVYHADTEVGSELDQTFQTMERRLLRAIMNPAMIATFGFGILLMVLTGYGGPGTGGWMHAKMGLALLLAGFHGACAVWRKKFTRGENTRSGIFFRWMNEVPTVILLLIVYLVVLKPF